MVLCEAAWRGRARRPGQNGGVAAIGSSITTGEWRKAKICKGLGRAVPSAVRRDIFVEYHPAVIISSVGAAHSDRHADYDNPTDAAPTELRAFLGLACKYSAPAALRIDLSHLSF